MGHSKHSNNKQLVHYHYLWNCWFLQGSSINIVLEGRGGDLKEASWQIHWLILKKKQSKRQTRFILKVWRPL